MSLALPTASFHRQVKKVADRFPLCLISEFFMNSEQASTASEQFQQQGHQCLIRGNYTQAASYYEQAILAEPDVKSHYWHLGLVLLLQGQEVEGQTTWLMAMMEGEPEQVEDWTAQLSSVCKKRQQGGKIEKIIPWLGQFASTSGKSVQQISTICCI
jgi:hypothetical protein